MSMIDEVDSYAHSNSMSYVVTVMGLEKAIDYIANPDIIEKWLIANRIYFDDIMLIDLMFSAANLRQEDDITEFWGKFNKKTVVMGIMVILCYGITSAMTVDDLIRNSKLLVGKLRNILDEISKNDK